MGQGPALVVPPNLMSSHLEMEWQIPHRRAAFEGLARGCRVVRYDCRGLGMSQREAIDLSMEAALSDLEAVVDALGLDRFALLRLPGSNDVAVAYAAAHPERVTHLIIWDGHNNDERDAELASQIEAVEPVLASDWDLYRKIRARLISGWDVGSNAQLVEELLRLTHSQDSMAAANQALRMTDPLPYLPQIQAPTLVLYRVGKPERERSARMFASRIQGASLVAVRETTFGVYPSAAGIAEILEFLNPDGDWRRIGHEEVQHGGLRVLLFCDLEKHTNMMQRLGDEQGRAVLREFEAITREALASYGGEEIKTMGDSFMASFVSAARALECAIALQRAFEARNETGSEPLNVRVGLSAGEPIEEDDDLFGASVILAARIADQAEGGEIVAANVVRELAAGKGFLFADRGEADLRGFEDPVHLYEIKWRA